MQRRIQLVHRFDVAAVRIQFVGHRKILGIDNTFDVTLETTEKLRPMIPPDITVVAESGIFSAADVERLSKVNVDAILVGEALVTAEDIPAKVRELSGQDRNATFMSPLHGSAT